MKNRSVVIICIALVSLYLSCKDEDNTGPGIVGEWGVEIRETYECPFADENMVRTCEDSSYYCYRYSFYEDGSVKLATANNRFLASGEYKFGNVWISITYDTDPYHMGDLPSAEASLVGDKLIIDDNWQPSGYCKIKTTLKRIN